MKFAAGDVVTFAKEHHIPYEFHYLTMDTHLTVVEVFQAPDWKQGQSLIIKQMPRPLEDGLLRGWHGERFKLLMSASLGSYMKQVLVDEQEADTGIFKQLASREHVPWRLSSLWR